jgi:hypothetical protein
MLQQLQHQAMMAEQQRASQQQLQHQAMMFEQQQQMLMLRQQQSLLLQPRQTYLPHPQPQQWAEQDRPGLTARVQYAIQADASLHTVLEGSQDH